MPLILDSPAPSENSADEREERRRLHHDADVVIVGAGIAGCAMAVALGKAGRSVLLLERSLKEPDRIVGELLQPGGVRALEKLGLSERYHFTGFRPKASDRWDSKGKERTTNAMKPARRATNNGGEVNGADRPFF